MSVTDPKIFRSMKIYVKSGLCDHDILFYGACEGWGITNFMSYIEGGVTKYEANFSIFLSPLQS